jgi:hypothetical protein
MLELAASNIPERASVDNEAILKKTAAPSYKWRGSSG